MSACAACGQPATDLQPYRFVVAVKVGATSTQYGNKRTTITTYAGPFLGRTLMFCADCIAKERKAHMRLLFGSAAVALVITAVAGFWPTPDGSDMMFILGSATLIAGVVFVYTTVNAIRWLRSRRVPEKRLAILFSTEIGTEARRLKPGSTGENVTRWYEEDFRKGYPNSPITQVG